MAKFLYQYHEERGQFNAYVSDKDGNTVWEVNYPDYYEDELTGEMIEGSTIFEDGFMRHVDDIQGLEKYLKSMGVLKSDDELVDDEDELEEEEEDYSKGGSVHDLNKVVVYDNNGETLDRYTVFTPDGSVYGMSENAEGFNQYVGDESEIKKGSHLGKRLKSVPEGIKWAIVQRMENDNYSKGGGVAPFEFETNGNKVFIHGTSNDVRKMYLDYVNNFITVKQFAEHYGISENQANLIIDRGKELQNTSRFSNGGITNKYKRYDFNEDGELEANIDGKKHVIKYRGDKSQMYDLYVNGKKFKSNKSVRELMKYADGGEIADEIKSKLTKAAAASENGMALPYEIAVYVPSTQDANKIVNRKEFQRRIDEVQKYLAELFGGFSANDVDGGYTSTDKQVIQEDIYRVVSFATKEAAKTKFPELIEQLSIWAGKWGQEAIGLEFEGDMFYVDKKTKLKRGGYFDKGGKLSNLSADEKEFIAKEKKERDGFTYRAKILFGSPVVLKEKNGTPVKKFAVDELPTANIIAKELNKYQDGGTLGAGSFADGGVTKRKSGNEPKVQRKVDELNRLIKLANENDIEITDNTSTWEAPMRYKPVKYSNGILYFEWDELDLYKANKGLGRVYKHKKDKVLKRSMEFDGIPSLNFLARRYRNALKNAGIQF